MSKSNIIYIPELQKMYHPGFARIRPLSEIVIHGTGGYVDNAPDLIQWMVSGEREKEYKKGEALFHYLIDVNGDIYQLFPNEKFVYHSGSGRHDEVTVGIEILNPAIDNNGGYEPMQYLSLIELIDDIMSQHKIETIVGHGYNKLKYSKKYKNCPGKYFDWIILESNLTSTGKTFKSGDECILNITG